MTRIVIIEGHPDPAPERFCRALADAYRAGAEKAGHELRTIVLGEVQAHPLRSRAEWEQPAEGAVKAWQDDLDWAEHVVVIYPLWLGDVPAALKAFFEQTMRPDFAFDPSRMAAGGKLKGRSARIVTTMGMPGWVYRGWFGAHSLKSLRRNILAFVGFAPVRASVFGMVEGASGRRRKAWLDAMTRWGVRAF